MLLLLILGLSDWQTGDTGIHRQLFPGAVVVSEQLDVYILDKDERTIQHHGPDGRAKGRFSRRGMGPGELNRPSHLKLIDGNLVVVDGFRLVTFSPAGDHVKTIRTPVPAVELHAVPGGWFQLETHLLKENDLPVRLAHFDASLENRSPVHDFSSERSRIPSEIYDPMMAYDQQVEDWSYLVVPGKGPSVFVHLAWDRQLYLFDAVTRRLTRTIRFG